ncbi:vitellin-degrading protease-like [Plodia interpunctella]|uniref:vitellin-degrading protease-like n=1 Tax=Plodia interpunctella TaxID=58824 RepID=UPI00236852FD|nr:vitellin-degrading protease-like [Plodia interpunctella]
MDWIRQCLVNNRIQSTAMLSMLLFILFFDSAVKVVIGKNVDFGGVSPDGVGLEGNHNVDIKQYPYHVSMVDVRNDFILHFCGGSILSPDYVLTAALCLTYMKEIDDPKFFKIRAGSSFYNKSGTVYDILSYVWHPQFNMETILENNVGIIKTEKMAINGVTTKAVQLPSGGSAMKPGSTVIITGFGVTNSEDFYTKFNVLQAVSATTISSQECKELTNVTVTDKSFCADSLGVGELGGPVVEKSSLVQYGIRLVSQYYINIHGTKIAGSEIHLFVPKLLDWIKQQAGL